MKKPLKTCEEAAQSIEEAAQSMLYKLLKKIQEAAQNMFYKLLKTCAPPG